MDMWSEMEAVWSALKGRNRSTASKLTRGGTNETKCVSCQMNCNSQAATSDDGKIRPTGEVLKGAVPQIATER